MTTLANIRAALNYELAVTDDSGDTTYPQAERNQAIEDAYADLWRAGVWNDTKQDITTVDDTWVYALTSIRKAYRMELLDSSSRILELPRGIIEPAGAGDGSYQVRLQNPLAADYTLRVRGWAPYISTFASDAATDDLPAEYGRIPLLKATAILYRHQLAKFARYGEAQALRPAMNVSADALLALISAAEREYANATRELSGLRPRVSLTSRL